MLLSCLKFIYATNCINFIFLLVLDIDIVCIVKFNIVGNINKLQTYKCKYMSLNNRDNMYHCKI